MSDTTADLKTDDAAGAESDNTQDLSDARDEWKLSDAAYSDQRSSEQEDLEFEGGKHWTEAELQWKKEKVKPAFTMDYLSGQVAKITNQPVHRIIVKANGGGADPTSAAYWQGLCRRIENLSSAEDVYKWARRHAIVMGRGFWRVRPDYFNQMEMKPDGQYDLSVFEQDIRIEPILNQHSVHPDPRCRMLDFSDPRFTIITDDLLWADFKVEFPDAEHSSQSDLHRVFASVADCPPKWATEKTVRVAERYYVVSQDVKLCMLKPGYTLPTGERLLKPLVVLDDPATQYPADAIVTKNTFKIPKVKWMKYTAGEVLKRADVPGRYIPVVMIAGERRIVDGKDDFRGLVRMAKGPQRLVDFMESRLAETIDLASYDVWLTESSTTEEFAAIWENIHIDRPSRLPWKAVMDGSGNTLPAPQHISVAPNISGIAVAAQRASMALRAVLGVPDVTPDELRPEQSGKAIKARQSEQAQATSHYADSTAGGIRHTARIIMSQGREIYTWPRILRINGADEKPIQLVVHNGQEQKPEAQQMAPPGPDQQRHMLDISIGDFDVTVAAGKGYQTGREETVDVMERVLPILTPEMQAKAVPILVKNMDSPGMAELATALEPQSPNANMVPVEQAQQAQQVIDHQTEIIHELKSQIDQKKAELDSKERMNGDDNLTKLNIARAQIDAKGTQAQLDAQVQRLEALIGVAHEQRMQVEQHAHEHATNVAQAAQAAAQAALAPEPTDGAPV